MAAFNAVDDVPASSHRHEMKLAMVDGHGGCRRNLPAIWRNEASAVAADREPAISQPGSLWSQPRACSHEVSILIATIGPLGRCRGVWPRSKVSMMIMRPPQCGQACASIASLALSLSAWALLA